MEREHENERAKSQVSEAEAKAAEPRAVEEHLRSEHLRKKAHVFEQRLARSERPFEEEQAAKSTDQMTWCAAEVEEYESMIGELTEELREFRAKDLEYGRTKAAVANFIEVNTPSFSPLGKRCGGCIKKLSAFKLSGGAWRRRLRIA
jgi:chromosome segregation ATPase